ncbi:PREDICTED: putative uncharacterized protein WWC2-AS2 [Chinchilla lanigera]|uniref:putative uncharacterized protein WWC2-AS2 n=1 Tax=Chinchilla lanigera TaxID=34839 RepID=UPI000696D69B|nr:PREDICTED: putative uncharacterized protein WWC2-AS2 [Chinchilla lanigera]
MGKQYTRLRGVKTRNDLMRPPKRAGAARGHGLQERVPHHGSEAVTKLGTLTEARQPAQVSRVGAPGALLNVQHSQRRELPGKADPRHPENAAANPRISPARAGSARRRSARRRRGPSAARQCPRAGSPGRAARSCRGPGPGWASPAGSPAGAACLKRPEPKNTTAPLPPPRSGAGVLEAGASGAWRGSPASPSVLGG